MSTPVDAELVHRVANLLPTSDQVVSPAQIHLTRLHGDASNRIYYRVGLPSKTLMLMQRPQAALESPSEEITKGPKIAEYAFLNIQRYLEAHAIRVPRVLGVSEKQDLLLLEDLGEITLEKRLKQEPESLRSIYEQALVTLCTWQKLPRDEKCIAWNRRFESELLTWEFEHFIEWGIERSLNLKIPAHEIKDLRAVFKDWVAEIENIPTLLTHRDFQSRNLMMLAPAHVAVIDFQDALVGPYVYDLVALLRDSYIELSEEDLTYLQDFYREQRGLSDAKAFLRAFDVQTIQRKLKDGGRFHYIHLFKGNPDFLPHFPASFRYAARALSHVPEGRHVLGILKKYRREFQ